MSSMRNMKSLKTEEVNIVQKLGCEGFDVRQTAKLGRKADECKNETRVRLHDKRYGNFTFL